MKRHKVISVVLSFLIVAVNILPTFAEIIHDEGLFYDVIGKNKNPLPGEMNNYITSIKTDSQGNPVYCMNARLPAPNGDDLPVGGELDDKAYRILKNGYPNKSFTGNRKKDYLVTQLAFWAYVDSSNVKIDKLVVMEGTKGNRVENPTLTKYVKDLYNLGVNGTETQSINVNFSDTNLVANFDGTNFVTPYFRVNVNGESISNGRFRIDMKTTVQGVRYQLRDGSFVTNIPMNTDFRVIIPRSAMEGSVSLRAIGEVTGKKVLWYKATRPNMQNVAKLEEIQVQAQSLDYANITWNVNGDLEVIKRSEDGSLLDGAEFKLMQNGVDVTPIQKTVNGRVTFTNIPFGEYDLVEVKAPNGHIIVTSSQRVTINPSQTTTVDVVNEKIKGRIKVLKVDEETGQSLKGAEFDLKNKATGQIVEKLVTGDDGTAISALHPFGEYVLQETKAPHKYTLNGQEHFVTISEHMKTIEVTAKNRIIKGKVAVNKSDSDIKDLKLEGIEFEISNEDGQVVDTLVTDINGYAVSKDLNYGKYFLKETKTLPTHILNSKVYEVDITEDGKVYTYDIENDVIKGKIQIVKVDKENEEVPVEGAIFDVIAEDVFGVANGTVVDKITSDKNGFAYTKDLRAGIYKIVETFAPNGYWQSDKEYFVDVTEHGKVYVKYISNKPIQAKLRVLKKDDNTKLPLAGAKFKIVDKKTGKDVEFKEFIGIIPIKKTVFTTDKNGEFVTPQHLRYGTYELVEVEAPQGYNLSEPIEFIIDENTSMEDIELLGTITTKEVINTRITGNMELLKIDRDTKDPLENVEFKVTGIDGFMRDKIWTLKSNKDGKVSLKDLEYGRYRIEEVKTIEGYVLNTNPIEFEIKEHGKTVKLEMTNKMIRGNVSVIKIDSEKLFDLPLKDVEFTIYDKQGKVVDKLVTNIFGYAKSKDLLYGKYTMRETKAPQGYKPSETVYEININTDGQIVKFDIENNVKKGKVEILKLDNELKKDLPLKGAEFTIYDINKNKVDKLVTDINGYAISKDLRYGKYTMRETKAPLGYLPSDKIYEIEIKEDGKVYSYEIENNIKKGKVEILKLDSELKKNLPLKGAEFTIYDINKNKVDKLVTDINGYAISKDLRYGKYTMRETKAPQGYLLSDKIYEIEIKEDGKVYSYEIENNIKKGKVEILKLDSELKKDLPLKGAEFTIYDMNKNEVDKLVTDINGYAISKDLRYGKYTMRETKAPQGYLLSDKIYEIEIREEGKVYSYEIENTIKKGKVEILKLDNELKKDLPLKDAEFTIYDMNKNEVDKLVTDINGYAISKDLRYGKYTMRETKVPQGYKPSETVYEININTDGQIVKFDIENNIKKGKVEILKLDNELKKDLPLKDAEFTIYDMNKNEVDKLVTDINGYAISKDLRYGKYTMRETKAPLGYLPSDKIYEIEIKEDGKTYTYEIENTIKKGKVEILKLDSELKEDLPLKGAEFTIYDMNKNEVDKLVTDINGYAISKDLRYGKYTMRETKAPQGYLPSDKIYEIEIKEDDKVYSYEIENTIKKGKVEILKLDSELKEDLPLKDAEFTIYDMNKNEVDKLVTDINGYAISKDLRYGKYTMRETKAPLGYLPSDEIYEIEIKEDGKTYTYEIENNIKKGRIEVVKLDSKTERKLEGAEFTIYDMNKNEVDKLITDTEGYAISKDLKYGRYTMRETKAPNGYLLSDEIYEIEIKEDSQVITFDITNDVIEGEVDFYKTDASTEEIIEGAKIVITGIDETNNHIKLEFTSSKDGNRFKVPYGKYEIKETIAPQGYIKTDEVGEFEIKEDGQVVKVQLKNHKIVANSENPKTGDVGILGISALAISSLGGLLYINLKNRKDEE